MKMNPQLHFDNREIVHDVSQRPGIPDRQNAIQILNDLFRAINQYSQECLSRGQGVIIPGFGTVFFINEFNKVIQKPTRELNFIFEKTFVDHMKLKVPIQEQLDTYAVSNMPFGERYGPIHKLNFKVIGQYCSHDPQDCLEGFTLFMEEFKRNIRSGQDGKVDFGFGIFHVNNFSAKFVLNNQIIQQLHQTGVMDRVVTQQSLVSTQTFRPTESSLFGPHRTIAK